VLGDTRGGKKGKGTEYSQLLIEERSFARGFGTMEKNSYSAWGEPKTLSLLWESDIRGSEGKTWVPLPSETKNSSHTKKLDQEGQAYLRQREYDKGRGGCIAAFFFEI